MTWMSYLTKTDAAEQVWTLMVIFPALGFFPVYSLTVSRTRKNHSQIPQWYGFIQKMFENKWTSEGELTWSFLDTHIWHISRNKSKCSRTRQNWTLMVNSPALGCFPVYGLTVSRTRKRHSEIPQWYGFIQKMFVNKWTSGCVLTWSFLDTYIWHSLRKKTKNAAEQDKMKQNKTKCSRTSLDTDGEFSSTRVLPGVRFDC